MQNKFFTAEEIFPGVTRIIGLSGEQCYLVEGEERALLIDGLTGVGSLKAFVRELTELPVALALTHGHIDHAPAIFEYGEGYIHPADIELMYWHCQKDKRIEDIRIMGHRPFRTEPVPSDFPDAVAVKTWPIYDGDIFDLGGLQLEVIEVAGHTSGSVAFLDRKHRCCYTGDCCNVNTLLAGHGATSIERYRESLLHFKSFQPEFDVCAGGHGPILVPNTVIDDGIMICDKILAGEDDAITVNMMGRESTLAMRRSDDPRGDNFRPIYGGWCNIVYDKARIYEKRERRVITGRPELLK